jgi:hypothetical protein
MNLLLSSYHSPPRKSDFSTPVAGLHLFKNLLDPDEEGIGSTISLCIRVKQILEQMKPCHWRGKIRFSWWRVIR